MADDKKRKIGVWGPSNSGKTSFLVSLMAENWARYNYVTTSIGDSIPFIPDFKQGLFPSPTDSNTDLPRYSYRFDKVIDDRGRTDDSRSYHLSLMDVAGIETSNRKANHYQEYYEELATCQGIIVMIDVNAIKISYKEGESRFGRGGEDYYSGLARLFDNLPSKNNKIEAFIAFCITKADLDPIWEKVKEHRHKPQIPFSVLEDFMGDEISALIQTRCDIRHRIAVFATSVVGRIKTESGNERPNIIPTGQDHQIRIYDPERRQAQHIVNPVLWLFKCLDPRQNDFDKL